MAFDLTLPLGSAAKVPLGKVRKPAVVVWPLVVTIGRRHEKPTFVTGTLAVAAAVAATLGDAVAATSGEAVATTGVSVKAGVTRFGGGCDVDLVPQAAVSASTATGTSRRLTMLSTGDDRGNGGRRQVLGKGAVRICNDPHVQHRRCRS